MNILAILLLALGAFALAYRCYARWIGRVLRESDSIPTPAMTLGDGRDFVPAPMPVLFSHHFSTIAGAGPIVGPTLACAYGVYPALLWVVLGSIFIGAVHDYGSMFVSLRERGRSIAQTTGDLTGRLGFILYIAFTLVMIVLVTGAFLDLSVAALTGAAPAAKLGLLDGNPMGWRMTTAPGGVAMVQVGGIATTSVIIMTLCAPLLGWLMHRRKLGALPGGVLACGIALLSVWAGMHWPVGFGGMEAGQVRAVCRDALRCYNFRPQRPGPAPAACRGGRWGIV
jgi:carbon starvation protein